MWVVDFPLFELVAPRELYGNAAASEKTQVRLGLGRCVNGRGDGEVVMIGEGREGK